MSPTSSRKRVPRSAASRRPRFICAAPVKAPFSYPKSSLSTRSLGRAAQFSFSKGPRLRGLARWIARATSSFPEPLSPVMSTFASLRATFATSARTCSIARLSPTIASAAPARLRSDSFSRLSSRSSSARSTVTFRRSGPNGFSTKSAAPIWVARTASSMVPWPDMMTTGRSGLNVLADSSR